MIIALKLMRSTYPGLRLYHQWVNIISKTLLYTLGCKGISLVCDKMRKVRQWIFYKIDFIQFKGKPCILDCRPFDLTKVTISPFLHYGRSCLFIRRIKLKKLYVNLFNLFFIKKKFTGLWWLTFFNFVN